MRGAARVTGLPSYAETLDPAEAVQTDDVVLLIRGNQVFRLSAAALGNPAVPPGGLPISAGGTGTNTAAGIVAALRSDTIMAGRPVTVGIDGLLRAMTDLEVAAMLGAFGGAARPPRADSTAWTADSTFLTADMTP